MVWLHLAPSLVMCPPAPLARFQLPKTLYIPQSQGICIIPSLYNILFLPFHSFHLTITYASVSAQISPSQTGVIYPLWYTPSCFVHSTRNVALLISQLH